MRIAIRILAGVCGVLMTVWVVGAIYYSPILGENLRLALGGIVVWPPRSLFFVLVIIAARLCI